MTSKKALEYLNDIAHGRKFDFNSTDYAQYLKSIVENDLEVLKIFKYHSPSTPHLAVLGNSKSYKEYISKMNKNCRYHTFMLELAYCEEDYNKIKEWLDND